MDHGIDPELDSPPLPEKASSFTGNVLIMAGGTALAQGLSILVAPFVTRFFAPHAFGLAALLASLTAVIILVSNLRYELSILLPKKDGDAANLLAVSLGFAFAFSGLSAVVVHIAGDPLLALLNAPDLKPFLWLIPVVVLVRGTILALSNWLSRRKRFGDMSLASVSESVTTNGMQVGFGSAGLGTPQWLIGSRVMGSLISMTLLGVQTWRNDRQVFKRSINWERMRAQAKRYRKFPLYGTWSALLNGISWQMPTFLLSAFFSTTVVGFYDLGTRTLRLPMDLLGGAIAKVFYQRAVKAGWDGNLAQVVEGVFKRLVAIGMLPMVLLSLIGRDAFVLVFGSNWAEAGLYAQILSIWTFFWFISSPLSTLFNVLERQEFGLRLNLVILGTRLVSLIIGGLLNDVRLALVLFGASGVIVYGYLGVAIMSEAGVAWAATGRILLSNLLISLPAALVIVILQSLGVSSVIVLAVSGLMLATYMSYRIATDHQLRKGLLAFIGLRS
jgi:O-antigen/teichoic acid export membrane protein